MGPCPKFSREWPLRSWADLVGTSEYEQVSDIRQTRVNDLPLPTPSFMVQSKLPKLSSCDKVGAVTVPTSPGYGQKTMGPEAGRPHTTLALGEAEREGKAGPVASAHPTPDPGPPS